MKTIAIPKGAINVGKFHDELLVAFPVWRGTKQADGTFENPLLGVVLTDQSIQLTVPDDADESAVQRVVAAHDPSQPQRNVILSQLLSSDAGMARAVEDLITALVAAGTWSWTDLPAHVKQKIDQRKQWRVSLQ